MIFHLTQEQLELIADGLVNLSAATPIMEAKQECLLIINTLLKQSLQQPKKVNYATVSYAIAACHNAQSTQLTDEYNMAYKSAAEELENIKDSNALLYIINHN